MEQRGNVEELVLVSVLKGCVCPVVLNDKQPAPFYSQIIYRSINNAGPVTPSLGHAWLPEQLK